MTSVSTIRRRVRFQWAGQRKVLQRESKATATAAGRTPRVARLMALAIRLEQLVHSGQAANYACLARLGHVTRARITQVTHLALLAPDIQEAILFLPPVMQGRDPITERDLRPLAAQPNWCRQRQMWARLNSPSQAGK